MSRICLRKRENHPRRMHTYLMRHVCHVSSNHIPLWSNPSTWWDHWLMIYPSLILFIIAETTLYSSTQVPESHLLSPRPITSFVSNTIKESGLRSLLITLSLHWSDIFSWPELLTANPLWQAVSSFLMTIEDAFLVWGLSLTLLPSSDQTYHCLLLPLLKWRPLNSWRPSPTLSLPDINRSHRCLRNKGEGRKETLKGGYRYTKGSAGPKQAL